MDPPVNSSMDVDDSAELPPAAETQLEGSNPVASEQLTRAASRVERQVRSASGNEESVLERAGLGQDHVQDQDQDQDHDEEMIADKDGDTAPDTLTHVSDVPESFAFAFNIERFFQLSADRLHSLYQEFAGYRWRLLIFPHGNGAPGYVSVYLDCGGPVPAASSPSQPGSGDASPFRASLVDPEYSWSRPASFKLMVVAAGSSDLQDDESMMDEEDARLYTGRRSGHCTIKEAPHRFTEREADWGFREFIRLDSLQDPREGFMHGDGSVTLRASVTLIDESALDTPFQVIHRDYRQETGFVGLKNQGATCYMNSLLQTLYFIGTFRKAVYQMPIPPLGGSTSTEQLDEQSMPYTEEMSFPLQKVFYELQYSPTVVKTKRLTASFGWDNSDAFTQHDVQELNRILCDHLEEKMKMQRPDDPSNTIASLFEGKLINYIECVNVPYKSAREESFYDLSLNVKGCRNIYESFEKYTEVEMMDGDNKYRADGYAELQKARKGVTFKRLPPVLQLHLKRFEYDFMRDMMVKINDRFEFSKQIDLSRFVHESDGSDVYVLHSVLVHVGDVHGGHYYVFIRPELAKDPESTVWYKFDDEIVSREKEQSAVEKNFGSGGEKEKKIAVVGGDPNMNADNTLHTNSPTAGNDQTLNGGQTPPSLYTAQQPRVRAVQAGRFSNAYMLQYVRKDRLGDILAEVEDREIPPQLSERIKREIEEEERRKKERAEQHLYVTVEVAFEEDLFANTEPDLVNWSKVPRLRVNRVCTLRDLKARIFEFYVNNVLGGGLAVAQQQLPRTRAEATDLASDTNDSDNVQVQRAIELEEGRRAAMLQQLQQHYLSNFNPALVRLWKGVERQNHTHRPETLLADGDDAVTIAEFMSSKVNHNTNSFGTYNTNVNSECMKIFAQIFLNDGDNRRHQELIGRHVQNGTLAMEDVPVQERIRKNPRTLLKNEVLIFLKYFVPSGVAPVRLAEGVRLVRTPPKLTYVGCIVVDRTERISSIRQELDIRSGLTSEQKILLYEEVKQDMVEPVGFDKTFEQAELSEGGDILIFQIDPGHLTSRSRKKSSRLNGIETKALAPGHGDMYNAELCDEQLHDGGLEMAEMDLESGAKTDAPVSASDAVTASPFVDSSGAEVEMSGLPLGGKPLLYAPEYIRYLIERVIVEFRPVVRDASAGISSRSIAGGGPDQALPMPASTTFELELLRSDSYEEVRERVGRVIGTSPNYLRLYGPDELTSATWSAEPVKYSSRYALEHLLQPGPYSMHTAMPLSNTTRIMNSGSDGGRKANVLWYERIEYPIQEFENMEEVRIVWRPDGGAPGNREWLDRYADKDADALRAASDAPPWTSTRALSCLVPFNSLYSAVEKELRSRLELPDEMGVHFLRIVDYNIVAQVAVNEAVQRAGSMFAVSGGAIPRDEGSYELRAEPRFDALPGYIAVAVLHLTKERDRRANGNLVFFGVPFIMQVQKQGEAVSEIRSRMRAMLGATSAAEFDEWGLYEVASGYKLEPLSDPGVIWIPPTGIKATLALEHRNAAPPTSRKAANFYSKPLKIR
ncbi:Ubiquitin carboxyl-terminal hydrolase 13 [Porphyridium purpureum]|uniref:Ubiquitin carboxyl-terminal hydrolase 13 n=1 Tax=Porphyridium purpureum TaxID=35688 RepID=A0A5J4Z6L3_PORPP|nr:Ubiquitin carboxyl-terminal hydrolase 13 [Porphyridium purpureum]|eukprot:POR4678..scf295_1